MRSWIVVATLLVAAGTTGTATGSPPDAEVEQDQLMRAMSDELARSMAQLQVQNLAKPYFIAYRIDDIESLESAASFGGLMGGGAQRRRRLTVEIRVGEPAFDNTNFLAFPDFSGGLSMAWLGPVSLPLDDDYQELRRKIWLATDATYKKALEDLSKKQAALQNKTRTDDLPDFAAQEPAVVNDVSSLAAFDAARAEKIVRGLSELFREMPAVYTSTVRLRHTNVLSRYVNSEGSRFARTRSRVGLETTASTQATDGMPLEDSVSVYGRSLDELPPYETLVKEVEAVGERLAALRDAPLLERYNGPVLFEREAAAELLAQLFVPKLLATRKPVSDNPQLTFAMQQMESSFESKLGARVLPRQLSLIDDPTLASVDEKRLLGGYAVDDDGVPASKTVLVENGRLKTLLSTRNPVPGVEASSGNRQGAGAMATNLIFSAEDGLSGEEMREEMMTLAADLDLEFGIVVRKISNPTLGGTRDPMQAMMRMIGQGGRGSAVSPVVVAFKVYPDGREELVRNVEIGDISAGSFRDVVEISAERYVGTVPIRTKAGASPLAGVMMFIGPQRGGSSTPLVSIATPSLLFEELTLSKPTGDIPNAPVVKHPHFR